MPGWSQIADEIAQTASAPNQPVDFDSVRRKYLVLLHEHTKRPVVLYATGWLQGASGSDTGISLGDVQGLMEVFRDLPGPDLDLILHSPGGDPAAADSIVTYMRSKYSNVRVFIPHAAMSAATMWALACDEIVMGKHSQLGPIDPQLVSGNMLVPARAILRQFETAAEECKKDPSRLSVWLPILQQIYPGLLETCRDAEALGVQLVKEWLERYMLRSDENAKTKAESIAEFFADADEHKAHARPIMREKARDKGVRVLDLEKDQLLQDLVLSVHHATTLTLAGTLTAKIIENHLGRAYVVRRNVAPVGFQVQLPAFGGPGLTLP